MDQGSIATVKALYKRITFAKAHTTHNSLIEFYKDYDILKAVRNLGEAWSQVTENNMKGVWKNLLQREKLSNESQFQVKEIVDEVVNLGKNLGFDDLSHEEIKECLTFDQKDISNEDLYELAQPTVYEEDKNDNVLPQNPAELSLKQLKEILKKGQDFTEFISELDPILERNSRVKNLIDDSLKCYREEAKEKSKKVQQKKISDFFKKSTETSGPSDQNLDEDLTLELSESDED